MYMAGRSLTASNPPSTLMSFAVYSCPVFFSIDYYLFLLEPHGHDDPPALCYTIVGNHARTVRALQSYLHITFDEGKTLYEIPGVEIDVQFLPVVFGADRALYLALVGIAREHDGFVLVKRKSHAVRDV